MARELTQTTGDSLHLYAHRVRHRGARTSHDVPAGATLHDWALPTTAVRALRPLGFGAESFSGRADVFHLTDYAWLPVRRAKLVATIHDVLFMRLPDCYTEIMRANLTAFTKRVAAEADAIVVPSTHTRDDLCMYFDVSPDRVFVTPLAARTLPAVSPMKRAVPYVLSVGTLEPRKNHARLFEAFDRFAGRVPEAELIVAGGKGWLCDAVVARANADARITLVGHAGDAALAAWMAGARVVAYPSLGEGFGLPVLEALAAGKPVLVGRGTPCADVIGNAGTCVDPHNVDEIADGLHELWGHSGEHAKRTADTARAQAARFTWRATARATLGCYRALVGPREVVA